MIQESGDYNEMAVQSLRFLHYFSDTAPTLRCSLDTLTSMD